MKPKVPTKAVCAEHLELRKEILTLLNLQKQVTLLYHSISKPSEYFRVILFVVSSHTTHASTHSPNSTIHLYHSPISYVFSVKLEVNWQYAWGKVIRRWGVLVLWHNLDHWLFGNQLQNKEAEGSSYREGSYTETPSTPKVRL